MEIRILMVMEPLHPAFEFYEGTISLPFVAWGCLFLFFRTWHI